MESSPAEPEVASQLNGIADVDTTQDGERNTEMTLWAHSVMCHQRFPHATAYTHVSPTPPMDAHLVLRGVKGQVANVQCTGQLQLLEVFLLWTQHSTCGRNMNDKC
jgi:hypothetical protein